MKKVQFLSFLATRQFLAFLAVIVVALVIWFAGPFVSFGGVKPLAAAAMRVLLIVLLLAGMLLWLAGRSTSVVLVVVVCLLIWFTSPLLAFGHTTPFEPTSARLIVIALVLAVFAIYGLLRIRQKMRDDAQFLKKPLYFGSRKEQLPAAPRLQKVEVIVARTLARLRSMRMGARGLGKLLQGQRYLYELPWYITLGANGSGKTSALMNAGLLFPLAEQMERAAGARPGDAAAVEWWLTNDAVLIDTAGYYTRHGTSTAQDIETPAGKPGERAEASTASSTAASTVVPGAAGNPSTANVSAEITKAGAPESTAAAASSSSATDVPVPPVTGPNRQEVDRAEWLGFLGMLRRHRPRAPINGALLSVDVATLASADEQTRIAEAAALRARLAELRQELGIRFPVYVLVTKMDRLTGFAEYFGDLTAEAHMSAWGFTLPAGEKTVAKTALRSRCRDELMQLAGRLSNTLGARLQDECDPLKRRPLAALPEEFAALVSPLVDLIERVFLDSRCDDTPLHSTLRGVYFTSARQGGGGLVAEHGTVAQQLPSRRGQGALDQVRYKGNQSLFLHDVLTRVVFPEAHLVSPNLR